MNRTQMNRTQMTKVQKIFFFFLVVEYDEYIKFFVCPMDFFLFMLFIYSLFYLYFYFVYLLYTVFGCR